MTLPAANLSVDVEVDQLTFEKTLTFNRAVSASEASQYLFGSPQYGVFLQALGGMSKNEAVKYRLVARDGSVLMQLRSEVRNAIIQGSLIRTTAKPFEFPFWVPLTAREDIKHDRLKLRVRCYTGSADWGRVIVWHVNDMVQIYQEFPADPDYYQQLTNDSRQARLLHYAYTQYNRDMWDFVDRLGMSPDNARSEVRRVNDEVFKLILEGAVAVLQSGAAMSQVHNAMRANAEKVASATSRSTRFASSGEGGRVRPVNGSVNVGGGMETPEMTNLNPINPNSGGPSSGIPNHVLGKMEQMDALFELSSADKVISNKLRFVDVDWPQAAKAAAKVLRPGGKVSMNVWCDGVQRKVLLQAFEDAGFKNVVLVGDGVGTMLSAVR